MTDDGVARLEALLSPQGRELLDRLGRETVTPDTALRIGTLLRAEYPAELVRDALAQHELRERARAKFSRAGEMFFTRDGLEQASAEVVARHRAARYAGLGRVADLCCGIGGDLIALAVHAEVLGVDRDGLHLRMAQANASAYGVAAQVSTLDSDVRDVDLAGVGAVFIDPARRSGQRRLRTGDSEPPLDWCLNVGGRVGPVGIKAAPGLAREVVPAGWELEFVAVGRELKEAVVWSPALATAARRATILPAGHTLTGLPDDTDPSDDDGAGAAARAGSGAAAGTGSGDRSGAGAVEVRAPGEFLFDPNPAVTRAGLVQHLARLIGAWKIDEQIAFLSADRALHTPFARTLRVIDSAPWDQKRLPARLRALDIGAVDIRRRGLAGDVAQLHRQLKLSGSRRATLVMTRAANRPWALICLDEDHP
ncbi:MAG TPA: class I SAM-dependent methyltransferase [Streptosporangiaceae bacterium]